MASATSVKGKGRFNVFDTVAASATDSVLLAADPGHKFRAVAVGLSCGATPSTVQFNSKPAGVGTAISPIWNNSISLPDCDSGWFETNTGEGLTVSTGAGSNTAVLLICERVPV